MSKKVRGSHRANIANQKRNRINREELQSTEDYEIEEDSIPKLDPSYNPILRPVQVEKSVREKLVELLKEWGAILASVTVIVGFSVWASSLQFSVSEAKETLIKHEKKIEDSSDKISKSEVATAVMAGDISNIKQNQETINRNIGSIQGMLQDMYRENSSRAKK